MPSRKAKSPTPPFKSAEAVPPPAPSAAIPEDSHPDYVGLTAGLTPLPDGPLPPMPPFPPLPPLPGIPPELPSIPSIPQPTLPPVLPGICGPVSGRYTLSRLPPPGGILPPPPFSPVKVTVRVDVDRFYPQHRISIEVTRVFPRSTAHAVAEVTRDQCLAYNRRRINATITYRDGDASLIPGDQLEFNAQRGPGKAYALYSLTVSGSGTVTRTYPLALRSRYFDPVEFEVDRVENAGDPVTQFDTGSHPNRPDDLPLETISLASVYQRAGFDVNLSPGASVIPASETGANGTWSDSEMHNAMVTYWSRFADRPAWAMWVLYAARHDSGRGLGGVMFDDIGPNHRQGTAIFTDSFIQDAPAGDAAAAAWRNRMQFWTAIHEMGHAFNLAHAWQKSLSMPGLPGPWIPLANEPESRSFMNYPFRVSGGQSAFFRDFRFRFTDDELLFMRHAPRRFVQMGNSDWFVNHGFEAPEALARSGDWELRLRPNRDANVYQFLEPVALELKLTNRTGEAQTADGHLLEDGRHIRVFVQREGGATRQWRPLLTSCHALETVAIEPGESLYGSHLISASTSGWMIDEPGFYKLQAAVEHDGRIVVSNVLRLFVAPSARTEENALASSYFSEDVGRVLAFSGAPNLGGAVSTLETLVERCPEHPAAIHAALALSSPRLRDYKVLEVGADRPAWAVRCRKASLKEAMPSQSRALLAKPDGAADTLGHIAFFQALDTLAKSARAAGDDKGALGVLENSVRIMRSRKVLETVIKAAESALAGLKKR